MSKTDRRDFLTKSAPLMAAPFVMPGLAGVVLAGSTPVNLEHAAAPDIQVEWRFCGKCMSLFYNGFPAKGRCSAGGAHNAQGFVFHLPFNTPETPKAQIEWRFCNKCFVMFWNGNPRKGVCPAGGVHTAQGYIFTLPHDIAPNGNNQDKWRYCQKCMGMAFDGFPNKGTCPAGGVHSPYGYMFVLPHDIQPDYRTSARLNTDGWAPINGNMDIAVKQTGDYTFWGRIHNSGAVNIRFSLAASLTTPNGQSFGFAVTGKRVDGTETIFGRNRDHSWNYSNNNPALAQHFGQLGRATLNWRLVASATITETITNYLQNLGKEALQKMIKEANVAPGVKLANFYMNIISTL